MGQVTYGNKSQGQSSGFPTNQKWTFQDANEVKTVVNSNDTTFVAHAASSLNPHGPNLEQTTIDFIAQDRVPS